MSIKSDKWMCRMAEQQAMIEPFEPGQVRYDDKGQRLPCTCVMPNMLNIPPYACKKPDNYVFWDIFLRCGRRHPLARGQALLPIA